MSAVAKRAKPNRKPDSAAETLDQLESIGDRIGNWIAENAAWVLGAGVLVLVSAGGYGFVSSQQTETRQEASAALAKVEAAYLQAVGGSVDSLEIKELANPETARQVRETYVERYSELSAEYAGRIEGSLAALETGGLQLLLGRSDAAIATWQAALTTSSDHPAIRGLLFERIAGAHEAAGRWDEAASAYAAASEIEDFPIRYLAMGEAARCYLEAGQAEQALALLDRLESEAPAQRIAPHILARLSELRAIQ